jgi:competence protein ComEC
MLWQTRWRFAGVALIAGGVALAPTLPAPDILIGQDGELVAVRGADGTLSAIGARGANFELERWLEHDGSPDAVTEAAAARAFTCDGIGCRAQVKDFDVAVARHPAAFAEDCRRAAILISPLVSPRGCSTPRTVVDFFAARRAGTHALYIGADGSIRVETVAAARGTRPWSMPARRGAPAGFDTPARRTAGLQ